jgi:cytoskeletal protein RodZ
MADEFEQQPGLPLGVGEQLRAAREARGLSLAEVAAETRIPQRHLQTIEAGDFAALPARTYAIGFARTYAKAVGLHDGDVANLVRAELDAQEPRQRNRGAGFEPGDPARVPSSGLVWLVVGALVLLLLGGFFFFRTLFAPAAELPSLVEQQRATQTAQAEAQRPAAQRPAAAGVSGPVVFTALDQAWVRFYTPQGTLTERLMLKGETYTVPADAVQPMLRTGRPDALAISVGGRRVPKIAEEQTVVSDVPITAAALLAPRPAPTAARASPATSPTT